MPEQDMREKIVNALWCCTHSGNCMKCWYNHRGTRDCLHRLLVDAHELLKTQEAEVPIKKQSKHGWFFYCPKCETILNDMAKPKYCSECGQAVKWE